jgi:NAD(P)-dependent dehydrogenase (short-subunit alcohol dehydrogenase family)
MNMAELNLNQILPAFRMIFAGNKRLNLRLDQSEPVLKLVQNSRLLQKLGELHEEAPEGLLVNPLFLKKGQLENDLSDIRKAYAGDDFPRLILIEDFGLLVLETSSKALDILLEFFLLHLQKFTGSGVTTNDLHLENQALQVKLDDVQLMKTIPGRLESKIAVITGAAQGFGRGIAELLHREGANIVVADLNKAAGEEFVAELNRYQYRNQALFCKVNVAEPESVEKLVSKTVAHFGGVDLLISNAGVLKAGGLNEMDEKSFDFVTSVNYKGFFLCTKYFSEPMKVQNYYRPDYFSDIIQVNSKSGLQGSNKNFAYAGGKFGGIGLTQSFALELVPHRIKVNAICPGNYFEGPLWSDPEKGLFAQYLQAGKVPGAKNLEDVKKFYESKVPMARGCYPSDVVKAILYAVEQEYETGQAIPVTGGQVMLN